MPSNTNQTQAPKGPNVTSETVYEDGSGWVALVNVRGVMFRASHVAGQVTVGMAPYKHPPRAPRWAGEYVRKWAEKRVAALSADYHAKHAAMYADVVPA